MRSNGARCLAALLLAVATACAASASYDGTSFQCEIDVDCPAEQTCQAGLCADGRTGELPPVRTNTGLAAVSRAAETGTSLGFSGACGLPQGANQIMDQFTSGALPSLWLDSAAQRGGRIVPETIVENSGPNGVLKLAVSGAGDAWIGTGCGWQVDGNSIYVRLVSPLVGPGRFSLEMLDADGNGPTLSVTATTLRATSGSQVVEVPIKPGHAWLRIDIRSGQLIFRTSPVGAGWSTLAAIDNVGGETQFAVRMRASGAAGSAETSVLIDSVNGGSPKSAWNNFEDAYDVDGNGVVNEADSQAVLDRLGESGLGAYPLTRPSGEKFYDTNGDGSGSPIDALLIINFLNAGS